MKTMSKTITEEEQKLQDWMDECKYMPPNLRDFHDQKDLFKAIHGSIELGEDLQLITWVKGHCYVIDVFLWYMARRGYVLQKSRAKLKFRDLECDVSDYKKMRSENFASLLNKLTD